mmetsp:Transcript_2336/g.4726  ORF Transcript_2336/g.4726 Transcript_2336/m.4726 type:complete len:368 (-) Transcript_2336:295-1398(-)
MEHLPWVHLILTCVALGAIQPSLYGIQARHLNATYIRSKDNDLENQRAQRPAPQVVLNGVSLALSSVTLALSTVSLALDGVSMALNGACMSMNYSTVDALARLNASKETEHPKRTAMVVETYYPTSIPSLSTEAVTETKAATPAITAISHLGGHQILNARYAGLDDSSFLNRHKSKLLFGHKFIGVTAKLDALVDAVKRNQGNVFIWVDDTVVMRREMPSSEILGDNDLLLLREIHWPKSFINVGAIVLRGSPTVLRMLQDAVVQVARRGFLDRVVLSCFLSRKHTPKRYTQQVCSKLASYDQTVKWGFLPCSAGVVVPSQECQPRECDDGEPPRLLKFIGSDSEKMNCLRKLQQTSAATNGTSFMN